MSTVDPPVPDPHDSRAGQAMPPPPPPPPRSPYSSQPPAGTAIPSAGPPAAPTSALPPPLSPAPLAPQSSSGRWRGAHVAIAGVLGLIVGGIGGFAVKSSDDTNPSVATEASVLTTSVPTTAVSAPTTTAAATTTTRATPTTTAASTTTSAIAAGTRAQPIPLGTAVQLSTKDTNWTVRVLEANLDASAAVVKANTFNKPAPVGVRYVLVTMEATYNGPKDSSKFVLDVSLKAIDSSNVETKSCGDYGAYAFGNDDSSKEVFQKGTITVRQCFAPAADSVGSLVMIASPSFSLTSARSFLAIK